MGNPVETECCHPEAEAWRNYVFEQGVTSLRISPAEGGKWRWLLLAAWFVWIVSATGAWQEGPPTHPHGAPQPTEAARRGRDQFLKTCAFCHGPDANGGSAGPNLLRSAVVRHDENGNLIGEVVRDGRPDKGMPAFQLSASQIQDIAAFLHFRILQSDRASPLRPGANFADAKVLIRQCRGRQSLLFRKGEMRRVPFPHRRFGRNCAPVSGGGVASALSLPSRSAPHRGRYGCLRSPIHGHDSAADGIRCGDSRRRRLVPILAGQQGEADCTR